MQVKNSYIFIPIEKPKKENTLVIESSIVSIFENYFSIDSENIALDELKNNTTRFIRERLNQHSKIERGRFDYEIDGIKIPIEYKFTEVDSVYYLDVIIKDKKSNIISCLEKINDILLLKKAFAQNYLVIISYDYVSEVYCNKIYPILGKFERLLRKLMFLAFTSEFKELYFEAIAPEEMKKDVEEKIGHKENTKKEVYRRQQYFYGLEMGQIISLLFEENWSSKEEKQRLELMNKDLSSIRTEELKKAISELRPHSNWNRFFGNKGFSNDIEEIMAKIRKLRNLVAHNRLFFESEYKELDALLRDNIKKIDGAIAKTEAEDFVKINKKKNQEFLENMQNSIRQMLNSVTEALEKINIDELIEPTVARIRESIKVIDYEKMKSVLPRQNLIENFKMASDITKQNQKGD